MRTRSVQVSITVIISYLKRQHFIGLKKILMCILSSYSFHEDCFQQSLLIWIWIIFAFFVFYFYDFQNSQKIKNKITHPTVVYNVQYIVQPCPIKYATVSLIRTRNKCLNYPINRTFSSGKVFHDWNYMNLLNQLEAGYIIFIGKVVSLSLSDSSQPTGKVFQIKNLEDSFKLTRKGNLMFKFKTLL